MPRSAKASDSTYNARRRYARSAERYLNKAEQTTGATAGRYRQLARQQLDKALATYQGTKQKVQARISNVAARLGVEPAPRRTTQETRSLIQESFASLETRNVDTRREMESRAILTSPDIGKRVLGGLVDVWKPRVPTVNGKLQTNRIYDVLFSYFDVSSYTELLERIESLVGDALYQQGDNDAIYDTVKLTLQARMLDNSLVQ